MRGFALPDEYAPVAVINSADSINAKIFTLLHEVVHILLGESALTGSGDFDTEFSGGQSEEQFCNRVAAEVVIPESDIRSRINSSWDLESLDSLKALCRIYKTSQAVVAIRLSELGLIHADALREMLAILQSRRAAPDNDRDVRIPTYRLALSRNGEQFSRIAIEAFHNGAIHGGELSSLVNMKLKHLPALEFELFPERIQAFA
jgi:Zn-dependent peptidase ImmA (M78 family)